MSRTIIFYGQYYITTVLFVLLCLPLPAQKQVETQSLLWTRYHLKVQIDTNWQVRQEVEKRVYRFPWRGHQFVSRIFAERKMGKGWNLGVGFTYFLQSNPQDPDIREFENTLELRPVFELAYRQSLSEKLSISHRYWSEFRFFEQADGGFEYLNNRSRYKLELRYLLAKKVFFKAFNEIHINVGGQVVQNVFDQNRIGTGFLYMPSKAFGIEVEYFNWFQQRKSGIDFYNRHIMRCTLHHTLRVKNKAKANV